MKREMVTIPKTEYDQLVKDSNFLDLLKDCGVNNWEGYSEARRLEGDEDENEDD